MQEEVESNRRISVDLPVNLIERFDNLKREWGLRGRGAVLKRLLEELLIDEDELSEVNKNYNNQTNSDTTSVVETQVEDLSYEDTTALVLLGKHEIELRDKGLKVIDNVLKNPSRNTFIENSNNPKGIDLPGFVSTRTQKLKQSLGKTKQLEQPEEALFSPIAKKDIKAALLQSKEHWLSIYGQDPNENIVEAAMIWLARDIWLNIEGSEGRPFTWSAANKLMTKYFLDWQLLSPTLERIIVIAGVLEDPFASSSLSTRIPTLTRRFVNSFRRRKNSTSFQTLDSTMTVHGALKILDLPTYSGTELTLKYIRDAYKKKALNEHPDAGGSEVQMRRVNEAYQLLKELYRSKRRKSLP